VQKDFCNNICHKQTNAPQQTAFAGCSDLLDHLVGKPKRPQFR
jgi:hypothetical protein